MLGGLAEFWGTVFGAETNKPTQVIKCSDAQRAAIVKEWEGAK